MRTVTVGLLGCGTVGQNVLRLLERRRDIFASMGVEVEVTGVLVRDRVVIPVRNSPKPPPERLSLTLPVINASKRVWMVLAGPDKASALGLALAGAELAEVPVAGVKGRKRTVFFVDRDAARDVPENLFLSAY